MNDKIIDVLRREVKKANKSDNVPIAAVIVKDGKIIAKAHNLKNSTHRIIDHAEVLAILKASKKIKDWRLDNCELHVTLEPCPMCREIIKQSRISKVFFYVESNFTSELSRVTPYKKVINTDLNVEFSTILQHFFKKKRG